MIDVQCKCEAEQPCSSYKFLKNIVDHSGIEVDLIVKSCNVGKSGSDSDSYMKRSIMFMDILKDIKQSVSEEIDLINKLNIADSVNLRSIFQRLIFSIEIAILVGQKSSSCELKVASDSFSSLSKLIEEMSKSLGDDITPGEYDEQEWNLFCVQYQEMLKTLITLFESQSMKRVKEHV